MRRTRTIVGSPDEPYCSPRHGSPRHDTLSPRSINSDGTFDRSMNTGSVIGHDDPTLVHTNIRGNLTRKREESIKNFNSGALDSFLTVSISEEENRDSVGDVRKANQPFLDYELRQQLVELDQTQDAWKAKQHEIMVDMDATEDFYYREVGELSLSSPKKKNFVVLEETIYEEEESRENDEPESNPWKTSNLEVDPIILARPDDHENVATGQPSFQVGGKVEIKTISCHPRFTEERESVVKALHDNQQRHHQKHQQTQVDSSTMPYLTLKDRSTETVASPVLQHQQQRESEQPCTRTVQRKSGENPVISGARNMTLGSTCHSRGKNEFDFENTSADGKKTLNRIDDDVFRKGKIDGDRSGRTDDYIFDEIEDDTLFFSTVPNIETNDTNEIIKAVQERLSLSSNTSSEVPFATDNIDDASIHQKSGKFRSWLPVSSRNNLSAEKKANTWVGSQNFASKVDRSNDEDDLNVETSFYRKRRKWKLFLMNICLALVIIASVTCAILFAIELSRTTSDIPTIDTEKNDIAEREPNETIDEYPPAESPISNASLGKTLLTDKTVEKLSSENQVPSESPSRLFEFPPNSLSGSQSKPSFEISARIPQSDSLASESPKGLQTPTISPASVGGKLRLISGKSIDDVSTPQYVAYDWLVNNDPADLDLDSLTKRDLNQRYIAALLYFSLDGANWFDQYGFLKKSHVCEWNNGSSRNKMGIICDSSERITGFAINENNLRGQLPDELRELTNMSLFQLRANHIRGTLPPGFDKLTMLEELDLRQNELEGTISEEIFHLPQIRRILFPRNSQLRGTIPDSIEKASNLEMLSFQKCRFTGSIPTTIGNLSKLFFFTFMENMLTGSIPESVTKLSQLEVLELSGNQLTGTIPDLANQDHLYFVSLFDNRLRGSIPKSLGILPSLMFLDIRNNQLDGSIPPGIGSLPDLVTFFAQDNLLSGNIPSFSGNKGLLQAINLSNNRLSGNIRIFEPDGPNERLVTVNLSRNNLTGSIPNSIGLFHSLSELSLEGNLLSGTIPKDVGLLRKINTLNLQENSLTGTLPEELGLTQQLIYLSVAKNQFEGTVPDTLGLLSKLTVLDMNSNQLVGSVPVSFSELSNLDELYLNNNYLTGDLSETFCRGYTSAFPFKYIEVFAADCMEPNSAVTCKCCTICCKDGNCLPVPTISGK